MMIDGMVPLVPNTVFLRALNSFSTSSASPKKKNEQDGGRASSRYRSVQW